MTALILTLATGVVGGLVFNKLKVPAGMLVGAIVTVSCLSVFTPFASMPADAKLCAQIITGAYIGCMISRDDLRHLPRVIKPYLVVMSSFFILNMVMGFIIWAISPMDLLTCLLCALPGGISDTPLIAMDMGADAAKVAIMQFVRLVFGIGVLPSLIVWFDTLMEKDPEKRKTAEKAAVKKRKAAEGSPARLAVTLAVSAVGGIAGRAAGIPAGALVASLLAVLCYKLIFNRAYLPLWCRRVAQVLSGCVIGCRMKYDDILELRYLFLPAILLLAGYVINCIVVGIILSRKFGFSRREGMLSVSPAGATEMALIAADMGVDSTDLVVLQIGRLVGVLTVFTQIISLMVKIIA